MSTATPQLPLALGSSPDQRIETYLHAASGVLEALRTAAETSTGEALCVSGPAGSGKTHLLLATAAHAREAGRRSAYVALGQAAGALAQVLPMFEGHDIVALDGVDAVAGHAADAAALFHLHNALRDSGAVPVYSMGAPLDATQWALPDLRSRVAQATQLKLRALDDAGRADVLSARARRRGLQVDDAAIEWMLKRTDRDLGSLTALLDRLDRASLAAQRRVTVPFLRDVLRDTD